MLDVPPEPPADADAAADGAAAVSAAPVAAFTAAPTATTAVTTIFSDSSLTFGDMSAPTLPIKLIASTAADKPGMAASSSDSSISFASAATNNASSAS